MKDQYEPLLADHSNSDNNGPLIHWLSEEKTQEDPLLNHSAAVTPSTTSENNNNNTRLQPLHSLSLVVKRQIVWSISVKIFYVLFIDDYWDEDIIAPLLIATVGNILLKVQSDNKKKKRKRTFQTREDRTNYREFVPAILLGILTSSLNVLIILALMSPFLLGVFLLSRSGISGSKLNLFHSMETDYFNELDEKREDEQLKLEAQIEKFQYLEDIARKEGSTRRKVNKSCIFLVILVFLLAIHSLVRATFSRDIPPLSQIVTKEKKVQALEFGQISILQRFNLSN